MTLFTNWYFIVIQSLYQTHDTHKHKKINFLKVFLKNEKKNPFNFFFKTKKRLKKKRKVKAISS
jgi:hypothetical protein